MKSGKSRQEEEEEEDDDFGTKKDTAASSNSNPKDGKNSDKANAMRSKHSVTEQRRRSKINERFQILRDLIPNSDQKRDTASFLLEVIQYVQFLQEKVQKYEGSYQPWSSEPAKLMPWRNSHWRGQTISGQQLTTRNGSAPAFPGRFDESSDFVPSATQPGQQIPSELDTIRNASGRSIDPQIELPNKAMGLPSSLQASMPVSITNDGAFSQSLHRPPLDVQPTECPLVADALNRHEDLTIEGGTISISSVYSQGLLNSLTEALQATGLDLSQASISIQINLGKQANRGASQQASRAKDHNMPMPSGNHGVGPFQDHPTNSEDLDQAHKRLKH